MYYTIHYNINQYNINRETIKPKYYRVKYHLPFLNRRTEHVSQAASPYLRAIDMYNSREPTKRKRQKVYNQPSMVAHLWSQHLEAETNSRVAWAI